MALLACALAATALNAQAGDKASASASLSQFSVELLDLAPEDGVAPQLLFYNRYAAAQTELWQTWKGTYQGTLRNNFRYTDGTSMVQYDDDLAAATAQLHKASALAHAGTDVGAIAISLVNEYYWLSPHTRMTVHWLAETDAARSPDNISRSSVELYATMYFSAAHTAEWTSFALSSTDADGAKSQPVTIQWSTGENAASGAFGLRTEARIGPSVVPIPEPQTWAMLLAGALVLIGASRAHSTKEAT
jgi:hypothetical protein